MTLCGLGLVYIPANVFSESFECVMLPPTSGPLHMSLILSGRLLPILHPLGLTNSHFLREAFPYFFNLSQILLLVSSESYMHLITMVLTKYFFYDYLINICPITGM